MSSQRFTDALFGVAGKTALVTGGTGGIGAMIAEGLVRAGARVLVCSRKPGACAATVQRLSPLGNCVGVPADVSSGEGIEVLVAAVREHFDDRLDLLVNNAGATWGAPLEQTPEPAWDKVVGLNLTAVFRLTVALLGPLRATATGADPARVINIGSLAGIRATDVDNYGYSASKAAVHMLTQHLARRLAGEQVTVNALAPGYFPSRMSAYVLDDPVARAEVERAIPVGRTGEPDDIVGATLFLASRAGAYLTGIVLPVDGGVVGCT